MTGASDARAQDLERRLTEQGRQLADYRSLVTQAEQRFGPRTDWERKAADAVTPSPDARPQGTQAAPGTVAPPAPTADPQEAAKWANWANQEFSTRLNGQVWQEPNPETGEIQLKRIPADLAEARAFALRMDPVLRGMGITPPWDGMYQFKPPGSTQQPGGNAEDRPLTLKEYQRLRDQEAKQDFRAGREFGRVMRGLGTEMKLAQSFFDEQVDVTQPDGTVEKASRAEAIEAYCVEHGVAPKQALMELYQGDMNAHWYNSVYSSAMTQAATDQRGLVTPGPVRSVPFPEPTPDQQKLAALDAVNRQSGASGFGGKPAEAADVVYDDQRGAPR